MAFLIDRPNGQNYAENIIDTLLLFDSGTWIVINEASTSTTYLDNSNKIVGLNSLLITNNSSVEPTLVGNSSQSTIIPNTGTYQLSFYVYNDPNTVGSINVSLYVFRNAVFYNTQDFIVGDTLPSGWHRFQADIDFNLTLNDDITFEFLFGPSTEGVDEIINFDGMMLSPKNGNAIVPNYVNPVGAKTQSFGVYNYNDLTTATAPINLITDTWATLVNDGAGTLTDLTYALNIVPTIYNGGTGLFDFSSLELGDVVDIRIDIEGTSTSVNQEFDIDLVLAIGTPIEYRIPFLIEANYKVAGSHRLLKYNSIYIGNTETRDNGARFEIKSSDSATVKINGWYCKVTKRLV